MRNTIWTKFEQFYFVHFISYQANMPDVRILNQQQWKKIYEKKQSRQVEPKKKDLIEKKF